MGSFFWQEASRKIRSGNLEIQFSAPASCLADFSTARRYQRFHATFKSPAERNAQFLSENKSRSSPNTTIKSQSSLPSPLPCRPSSVCTFGKLQRESIELRARARRSFSVGVVPRAAFSALQGVSFPTEIFSARGNSLIRLPLFIILRGTDAISPIPQHRLRKWELGLIDRNPTAFEFTRRLARDHSSL